MGIQVSGLSQRSCAFYKAKAEEFCRVLNITSFLKNKTIKISFRRSGFGKGDCARIFIPIHSSLATKNIRMPRIYMNKDTRKYSRDIKPDLIHELIHLKQYLTGKLKYIRYGLERPAYAFWKSKNIGRLRKIKYEDMPWEIEAQQLEKYYSRLK